LDQAPKKKKKKKKKKTKKKGSGVPNTTMTRASFLANRLVATADPAAVRMAVSCVACVNYFNFVKK
jgi:hypothetical protein